MCHIGPCFMRSLSRYWYQSPLLLWSATKRLMADYRNTTRSAETAVWPNPTSHPDKHSPIPYTHYLVGSNMSLILNSLAQMFIVGLKWSIQFITTKPNTGFIANCKLRHCLGLTDWFDPLKIWQKNTMERKDGAVGGEFRCKPEPHREPAPLTTVCQKVDLWDYGKFDEYNCWRLEVKSWLWLW